MKVAYIFTTNLSHYILSNMIIPQLERNEHVADVVGMFFFGDNTLLLVRGNDVGERLIKIAKSTGMLVMACDKCAFDRKIDSDLVEGAMIGCFPDLYKSLNEIGVDQVITL